MRYVSLCSGIEATTVAWSKLGWEPLAFSEIDPFACAVLAVRFPDVPNLGDMMKIDWRDFHERNGIVDVLFASTPCQSFSIAGNRLGLDGESGLMWGFVRAARDLLDASGGTSPRYVVWENVPGCLSSGPKGKKGEDFRCLLAALDECGFGVSWRVLDSQFARIPGGEKDGFRGPVAQRRRRVYLVGSLGTDGSAEILFERASLRRDNPPSKQARKALAADAEGCVAAGGVSRAMSLTTANMGSANGGNTNGEDVAYTIDTLNSNAVALERERESNLHRLGQAERADRPRDVWDARRGPRAAYRRARSGVVQSGQERAVSAAHRADAGHGHVGGSRPPCCVLSNGDEVIGALCACDHKWVQNQQVNQGKIICQRKSMY